MQHSVTAIPFILSSDKGFFVTPESISMLTKLTSPLAIVSIVGKYRSGKSLFVNRVLINQKNGFKVGSTVNPCTKGLWLWHQTIKSQNPDFADSQVLIIDTEGFGGTDQGSNHDQQVLLFALLLSSFFIYNSTGSIDQNSLNSLSVIINLAKDIQSKIGQDSQSYFPSFLWVVRDFTLQIVDKQGSPINSKEYLQKALELQKGVSDSIQNKNKLRRLFKHFFKDRDCATLVRPVQTQTQLQNLSSLEDGELRPQFLQQAKMLRRKIFRKIKPKCIQDKFLTGPTFIELASAYVQTVNSGGLPNIPNAWNYVRKRGSQKAYYQTIEQTELKMAQIGDKLTIEQFKSLKKGLLKESYDAFRKQAFGNEAELSQYITNLQKEVHSKISKFKQTNADKWNKHYSQISEELLANFKQAFESQSVKTLGEYRSRVSSLVSQFKTKSQNGPYKGQFATQLQLRICNQYMGRLLAATQTKRQRDVQLASIKFQHIEQELKLEKLNVKSLQQNLWQAQKQCADYKQEADKNSKRSEQAVKTLKLEIKKLQSQLITKKGQEQNIQRQTELLKKMLDDSKLRIQNLNARLTESQISRKQLLQQNKRLLRQQQNHKYQITNQLQQIAHLQKDLARSQQSSQKYKLKESKIQTNFNVLKYEHQCKQKELLQSNTQVGMLQKELSSYRTRIGELQQSLKTVKQKLDCTQKQNSFVTESMRQNLEKQLVAKDELTQTNKNLSSAIARMQTRSKQAEQKIQSLKQYKNAIKNALCLQCRHCNKFIACAIFTQHLGVCSNQEAGRNQIQLVHKTSTSISQTTSPASMQINIIQTLVREYDNKPYTEYVISLCKKGFKWEITRKYKAFCQLHNSLKINLPGVFLSDVAYVVNPQQGNRKSLLIEQRRKMLQKYLKDISQNSLVVQQSCYMNFMEIPKQNEQNIDLDKALLPQSPEEFLKSWNQRNLRLKETNSRMYNKSRQP